MKKITTISVIIPTYNRPELLKKKLLVVLQNQQYLMKLLFVMVVICDSFQNKN